MVEIALPKNPKITTGKTWPYPSGATKLKEFRIYRFNPDARPGAGRTVANPGRTFDPSKK
jgi:hypothetical protein